MSANSGFERLLRAVGERRNRRSRAIGRLHGSARTAVAAAWATLAGQPVMLVTARDPVNVASDLDHLLRALGSTIPVLRLPGAAVNPYAGVAPHAEVLERTGRINPVDQVRIIKFEAVTTTNLSLRSRSLRNDTL